MSQYLHKPRTWNTMVESSTVHLYWPVESAHRRHVHEGTSITFQSSIYMRFHSHLYGTLPWFGEITMRDTGDLPSWRDVLLWTILFSENITFTIQLITIYIWTTSTQLKVTLHKVFKVLDLDLSSTICLSLEVCCSTCRVQPQLKYSRSDARGLYGMRTWTKLHKNETLGFRLKITDVILHFLQNLFLGSTVLNVQ